MGLGFWFSWWREYGWRWDGWHYADWGHGERRGWWRSRHYN
jgi:hypothetical protein